MTVSTAPVASSPLLGFSELPKHPLSLIDIHGLYDHIFPYDYNYAYGTGNYKLIDWKMHLLILFVGWITRIMDRSFYPTISCVKWFCQGSNTTLSKLELIWYM